MTSLKTNKYSLLPFKFKRVNGIELIVNEVGDYLFAPKGTVKNIIERNISQSSVLYKDLLSKYIICEDYNEYLQDIIATRLRTKKAFLDNFTTLHIFVLTIRCNQKCIYCQASSKDKTAARRDMSLENLEHAIDLMLKTPAKCITMEFQGGDCSLVPSLVENAVLLTKKKNERIGKVIKFVLCTNLILLPDKLISLCKQHNIFISTSLDGPELVHDHNRGMNGSYKAFVSTLKRLQTELESGMVSPLMTTSDLSLNYPKEIINTYRALGFNSIFLRPLNPYGRAKKERWDKYNRDYLVFYKTALEYIISLNLDGIDFREDFTAMVLKKIITPFPIGFVDLQSPAGIINSVIVYNYDGYVYCSDESRMMAEEGDYSFRLGKVDESYIDIFYGKKAQELSRVWATEYIAGCSDCAYFQYCGADPVRNHATQKDLYGFRPSSIFCKFHQDVLDHLFELIYKRGNELMPIFRRWVYER